ncbi:amidohydrolase [Brucella anthropi]|uniref:M20 metallopeptidase family protein n=1 Tax=Brucella anthropi TaxID=529 RepID=UPI00267302F3|nr:amidohydrolase [Brucella anthropi]WKT93659.1 amidohydrolase [Brucella anthropi]
MTGTTNNAGAKLKTLELARSEQNYMRELRREFHKHPELSLNERRTSARIREELDAIGVPYILVGEFGIVATIAGSQSERVIALRADMDALPIEEDNPHLEYRSGTARVMHACGHDGHVAMLLGAARILMKSRDQLHGTVKLCFQQAEEVGEGTEDILKELARHPVESVLGIHLWSELETGKISIESGPRMAAGQSIDLTIHGVGTHGAYPNRGIDPIIATAAIILNCAALVSREFDPTEPVALTFGSICGGNADNVIPDKVSVSGTMRATRPEIMNYLEEALKRTVTSTADAYRTRAEIRFSGGVSAVTNDPACSNVARRAIQSLGLEKDCTSFNTVMASENFADFLKVYPGAFAFIGVRNEEIDAVHPHHHPKFNIDEDFLFRGAALYAQYSIEYFRSENKEKHNG